MRGMKHGAGRLLYSDNTSYVGHFNEDIIHGMGVSSSRFHRYEGSWSEGKIHGNGVSTFFNLNN